MHIIGFDPGLFLFCLAISVPVLTVWALWRQAGGGR